MTTLEPQAAGSAHPDRLTETLRRVFGFSRFRPLQREVIESLLAGTDTLAVMPTGGGKSLCYQLPALLNDGLTVVVSPLIALMKDQVEQMRALGVPALQLNSALDMDTYRANVNAVRSGETRLLYVAPETLLTPRLFDLLDATPPRALVIDEAHCISEWGHDFRKDYRQLIDVRRRYADAVCLAMTATATPRVRDDIENALGFKDANRFVAGFDRPNLFIDVRPKRDPERQLLEFLESRKGESGIVYCFTRKQTEETAAWLAANGHRALPYHAGLEDDVRHRHQEAFIRDDAPIIAATIAFGMGINKPNVRFVVHYDLPKSLEGYYQEIGRAGRDGLPAHCLLFFSLSDVMKLRYILKDKEAKERQLAERHLQEMIRYAENERHCRRKTILTYFGETWTRAGCDGCDVCAGHEGEPVDVTIHAQKLLSCAIRTGERFGIAHLVAVLRGSRAEAILRNGHDRVTTYGIGKAWTEDQWRELGRALIRQGYFEQDETYRTLRLTPKAREALRARAPIKAPAPEAVSARTRRPARGPSDMEHDRELFEQLRALRKRLADEAGVPPYVIFSDRTLVEMSAYFPQSRTTLAAVHGMGAVKLDRYGGAFLDVLCAYGREHARAERPVPDRREPTVSASPRRAQLVAAYEQGETVDALAARLGIQPKTVINHLSDHIKDGETLRLGDDLLETGLSPEDLKAVRAAFKELGLERLRPVFERFEGRVTYSALHRIRLHALIEATVVRRP